MGHTWRDSCKQLIADTIKENDGKESKEVKKALREAYPFGERKYHPYKIWCDEVRVQLGLKKKNIRGAINDPLQGKLF